MPSRPQVSKYYYDLTISLTDVVSAMLIVVIWSKFSIIRNSK